MKYVRKVTGFQFSSEHSIKWATYLNKGPICFHFSENHHLLRTRLCVELERGTQSESCAAACAAKPKLSIKEYVVFLSKGRLPVWQFLLHVYASIKLGFSSILGDFLAENWENSPILRLGKGPITGPKFGVGKSVHFDLHVDL